jgi:hypothetical protein
MIIEEARRIDFLAGQVHSLIGFALAMVNTHPDPAKLQKHLEAADLAAVSVAGGLLVSDDFLKGMEDVAVRLRVSVETALQRQAIPPTESD